METNNNPACKVNIGGNNVVQIQAKWDRVAHLCFIDLCEEEIEKGNKVGTCLTRESWKNLTRRFNKAMGRNYTEKQMKTRWNTIRADWKLFKELVKGEKGLKWDGAKNTIAVDGKWWDEKIKVNEKFRKFRNKDLSSIWFHYDALFSNVRGGIELEVGDSSYSNRGKNAATVYGKPGGDNATSGKAIVGKKRERSAFNSSVESVNELRKMVTERTGVIPWSKRLLHGEQSGGADDDNDNGNDDEGDGVDDKDGDDIFLEQVAASAFMALIMMDDDDEWRMMKKMKDCPWREDRIKLTNFFLYCGELLTSRQVTHKQVSNFDIAWRSIADRYVQRKDAIIRNVKHRAKRRSKKKLGKVVRVLESLQDVVKRSPLYCESVTHLKNNGPSRDVFLALDRDESRVKYLETMTGVSRHTLRDMNRD